MALSLGELHGTIGLDDTAFGSALEKAQGQLKSFGTKGAVIAAAAGAAIGAAVGAAVLKSMDIGKANDKLAAQLGLTANESKKAGKVAGSLYANAYGDSLEEVNTAVGAVMSSIKGMRNASSADVEAMTTRVLNLSKAFDLDVGRAAQVAGQMITNGLAKDGAEAADLLTVALQKVPAAVREDVLDATDEYGPFFANLGISGEKAMGMLVKASEKGMYGIDKTGDALKEFGIRATDMSTASGAAYEALGLDQQAMTNDLLAGGDTAADAFQKIVGGLQGMEDPAARSQAALALFGTPLEDLSVTEIPKFLGSLSGAETGLGDVAGAADKMGETLNDNAATNFESFKRGLTTTFVDIVGGRVLPAIENAASYLATKLGPAVQDVGRFLNERALPALSAFGDWFVANQGTIATIATLISALLIPVFVRLGVRALVSAAAQVTAWAMSSGGAVKAAAAYVVSSYTIIGRWVAMGAAAVVSGAQTVAIWTLYKVEAGKGAIAYGVQSARVAAAWIVMSAAAVASGAKTAAVWTGTVIAQAARGAAAFALQAGRVVGGWVLMGAQSLIQAARMAAAWLIAMGPVGWVIAAVVALVALIIANWDKVSAWTKKAWTAVTDYVVTAWRNVSRWTIDFLTSIGRWISDKFNAYLNLTRTVWGYIFGTIRDKWSDIKTTVFNALVAIAGWVYQKFTDAKNTASNIWNAVLTVLKNIWSGIKDTFERGVDGVASKWGELQESAKKPVRFVVNKVINEGLIDTFNKIPGVNIPRVPLPRGFRKGGYTGNGGVNEVAGDVHGQEYVLTAEEVKAAGGPGRVAALAQSLRSRVGDAAAAVHSHAASKAQAATGSSVFGGIPSFRGYQFDSVNRANELNVWGDAASRAYWGLRQAAASWNGLGNVRVNYANAAPGVMASEAYTPFPAMPNWAGYYMGSRIWLNPARRDMSPRARQTLATHEIGHALGLPHAMATGAYSVMNYSSMYGAGRPTAADATAMRAIYGAPGRGNQAVRISDPVFNPEQQQQRPSNPFDGLIDGLISKIKAQFPGGGMFVDAAGGLAKTGIGQVVKWVTDIKDGIKNIAGDVVENIKNFFGGGAALAGQSGNVPAGITPTLMDGGGWLRESDGPTVIHQKKKPDAFTPYDQYQEIMAQVAKGGSGDVYVQNPFTGDYLLAQVDHRVRREIKSQVGTAVTRRRGQ